jgi:hypothetical protein
MVTYHYWSYKNLRLLHLINALKLSWAISYKNVEQKTIISEASFVSINKVGWYYISPND